jgi:LmbE family N-acetylglucosaminyl deacetylase
MNDSYVNIFENVSRVLVVMAHPDDAEVYAGGTISRLTSEGKTVRLVVTTNGGKGNKDKKELTESELSVLRVKEQDEAAKIMGIEEGQSFNLGLPDGGIVPDMNTIERIVFHIREFKPDLIITHNPEDMFVEFSEESMWVNHKDHRNTAQAVVDAMYPLSRDLNFFPGHRGSMDVPSHTVTKLLMADYYNHKQSIRIDVEGFLNQKRNSLLAHKNALVIEDVDGIMTEVGYEDGYYEVFRYSEIY